MFLLPNDLNIILYKNDMNINDTENHQSIDQREIGETPMSQQKKAKASQSKGDKRRKSAMNGVSLDIRRMGENKMRDPLEL